MNKYITALFIIPLILLGCVDNGDEPTPPAPPKVVSLTADNLLGTWEVYYITNDIYLKGQDPFPLRDPEFDGSTTTFLDSENYYAHNAEGRKIQTGTYYIDGDSIRFHFVVQRNNLPKDTITAIRITQITEKTMTKLADYYGRFSKDSPTTYRFNDITEMRHTGRGPNELTNKVKIELTQAYLEGKWSLYRHQEILDGNVSYIDSIVGTVIEYKPDMTYTETTPKGQLAATGRYRIVDDVVHLFEGIDYSSTLWVKGKTVEKVDGVNVDQLRIYDERRLVVNDAVVIKMQNTYFRRLP